MSLIYFYLDGLYLATFCDGLNLLVLTPYRLKISELEKDLLKDHYLNVTYLQTHLENVNYLFVNYNFVFNVDNFLF